MNTYAKFNLVSQDERTLIYSRRYTPTWAIVLAVLGVLVFLLGLLFLLIKDTQTISISVSPAPVGRGSSIQITGEAHSAISTQIQDLLDPNARRELSA